MKKGIKITIKFIAFFFGWALCATVPLLPVMNWKNPPVWRFVAELIPLLSILIVSLIFWLIERKRISIAPIVIHFVWNYVGAIILGSVSLAEDYPSILETAYRGNQLLSGGFIR